MHESRHRGQPVLWIGTSNGLNRFDLKPTPGEKNTEFIIYREKDGLPNSVICGILEDDAGNLWLSTHKGISKFDPQANVFRNYDSADGLQSNIFHPGAFFKDQSGMLYFGGINGFNRVHPAGISENRHVPPVRITSIKLFNKPLRLNRNNGVVEIPEFAYDQNFLTFIFAALDFTAPEKNRYAYKLEGIDNDWQYAGRKNEAVYTSLNPGEYTFHVKAANNDGVWNQDGATVHFVIRPPFWQTAWFYLLCAILLGVVIYSIHYFRIKQKIRQSLLIERARQKERDWVREKTARDYHDELGHQLTKISLYSELIRQDLLLKNEVEDSSSGSHHPAKRISGETSQLTKNNGNARNGNSNGSNGNSVKNGVKNGNGNGSQQFDPPQILNYLNKITSASDHLCTDTRDFIWALNPEKDSFYETALHLKHFADELLEETGIRVTVSGLTKALETVKLSMDWRRHIILIFKEAMNNCLKHAECQTVKLEFAVVANNLQIRLIDDGKGLPPETPDGNGLRNMKKRANKINGTLKLISNSGKGTQIQFTSQNLAVGIANEIV